MIKYDRPELPAREEYGLNYREEPFEGDELDRMRARQQRKKQGTAQASGSRRHSSDPGITGYARNTARTAHYDPVEEEDDLRPDQIEELDMEDYDTYEKDRKSVV